MLLCREFLENLNTGITLCEFGRDCKLLTYTLQIQQHHTVTVLQYDSAGCLNNMYMSEKILLCAVDEMEKLIEHGEYMSKYASETFNTKS